MRRLSTYAQVLLVSIVNAQLHFVSLGNFGGPEQSNVSKALQTQAKTLPISMIVSPGSCFSQPIIGLDDEKWIEEFENQYAKPELNMQFFPVAGTGDWQGNVSSFTTMTKLVYSNGRKNLEESIILNLDRKGAKWTYPNYFYHYTKTFTDSTSSNVYKSGDQVTAFFLFIDTTILSPGFADISLTNEHWKFLENSLEHASKAHDWVFIVADKPIISSGSSGGDKYLFNHIEPLLKKYSIDAYISGADHNMELIDESNIAHINCGTGAFKGTGSKRERYSKFYSTTPGFCRHTITKEKFTTEFLDSNNKVLFSYDKKHNGKKLAKADRLYHAAKLPKVKLSHLPAGIGGVPITEKTETRNDLFVVIYSILGIISTLLITATFVLTFATRVSRWLGDRVVQIPVSDQKTKLISEKKKIKVTKTSTHSSKSHKKH